MINIGNRAGAHRRWAGGIGNRLTSSPSRLRRYMPTLLLLLVSTVASAQTPSATNTPLSFRAERPAGRTVEESQTSRQGGKPGAEVAATDFWQTLGDPTLAKLVGDALRGNHDVESARARVSGARAARVGSLLELTPAVSAVGGYSRQRLASGTVPGAGAGIRLPEQDVWDAGLRMSWDLDVFGRLRNSAQARGSLLEAADEDLKDVRVVLAAQVAKAYFDLRGAEDRLAVARRNAD